MLQEFDHFGVGSVVWDVQGSTKADAIRDVIARAGVFHAIPRFDLHAFGKAVLAREALGSTGLGHGVAVAHGKMTSVDRTAIALGIAHRGIPYDAPDGMPVSLLFVVANHPDRQADYLHLLSSVARVVRDRRLRERLLSCACGESARLQLCSAFSRLGEPVRSDYPSPVAI